MKLIISLFLIGMLIGCEHATTTTTSNVVFQEVPQTYVGTWETSCKHYYKDVVVIGKQQWTLFSVSCLSGKLTKTAQGKLGWLEQTGQMSFQQNTVALNATVLLENDRLLMVNNALHALFTVTDGKAITLYRI